MTAFSQAVRRVYRRRVGPQPAGEVFALPQQVDATAQVDISENDPILPFLQAAAGAVDLQALELDSPALDELRAAGIRLVVPLITHGELIGTLNLGPRLSEQDYSTDDRKLIENLASQAAPALRVAQLVREQEAEARERERFDQELRVAQLIQQHFLPLTLPQPPGWSVQAHYRPARAVGGDFYDIVQRRDGTLAFAVGDVTDKGVPAAMVMAATRSFLRAAGEELASPGEVLSRVNDLLHPDMPPRMFVTCLYGILEPSSGRVTFANAGHNLPIVCGHNTTQELRATGMPLGLLAGMRYDESQARLRRGQQMVLHSDGISEAHDTNREMFGIPRLRQVLANGDGGDRLLGTVLRELERFTGPDWEQEDDITLVSLGWNAGGLLAAFELPSETGREREAMERVATAVGSLGLSPDRIEKLKTAVAEATMNAIEHGNKNEPQRPVRITAEVTDGDLVVRVQDEGGATPIPIVETPDIGAKLSGEQGARGWGFFLIQQMVDSVRVTTQGSHHIVELVLHLTEASDA
jgi:serine phosphatase RsbU (regulator of sigma subunit)/anti-sigma regulatory factor (Ser/Thr protein kinase)